MKFLKFFLFLFFSISILLVNGQSEFRKLYEKREYEKCIEKCKKHLSKSPSDIPVLFIQSLCYFEMAQTPDKYKEFEENPLQESLKALGKVKSKDNEFLSSRGDTLTLIKDFAEEYAKELTEISKTKAIRIYRHLYKAFEGDFNTLQLVEIYFKTEEYEKGIIEIDKLFSYHNADINSENGDTYNAMQKAPMYLVSYGMFKNAYQLSEKYAEKYAVNQPIYNGLKQSMLYLLDTLYSSPDKMLFFEYSRDLKKLYQFDNDIQRKIYNLYIQLLNESEEKFSAIENPQSWRDTIALREFYKYSDMCISVMQNNDFYELEQKRTTKHKLEVPYADYQKFANAATEIINYYRTNGTNCNLGYAPEVDSVKWHDELARVAKAHARDMYAYNYADHLDRKQRDAKARIDESGLKGYKLNTFSGVQFMGALKVGEAISTGLSWHQVKSEEDIRDILIKLFKKFETSKNGYCEVMMDIEYTHFGIGLFGDRWVLLMAQIKIVQD